MATLAEQLAGLSVLDNLKHSSQPGSMTALPWQTAFGSWNEVTGWSPSSFIANPPTGTRSGLYINTGEVSGDYGLGLKKTTGSLATAGRQFELWLFYQGGEKATGYQLLILSESLTDEIQYILRKWVNGEATVLWESAKKQPFKENDSFFISKVGSKLRVHRRVGEGTPELVGEAEDSTYTKGYIGFGGNGSNPKLINLQGGNVTVATEGAPGGRIGQILAQSSITETLKKEENPLAGNWSKPSWVSSIGKTSTANGWTHEVGTPNTGGAKYTGATFTASGAKLIYIAASLNQAVNTAGRWFGVWAALQGTEQTGYRLRAVSTGVANQYTLKLEKVVAGAVTVLAEHAVTIPSAGAGAIALTVGEGKVKAWVRHAAANDFEELLSIAESTYTSGSSAIESEGTTWSMYDVKMGTLTAGGLQSMSKTLDELVIDDNLIRAEDPLNNNSKWETPSWVTKAKAIATFGFKVETAFGTGPDGSRWSTSLAPSATQHAISHMRLSHNNAAQEAGNWFAVWLFLQGTEQTGYRLKAEFVSGSTYKLKLEKVVAGTATVLGEVNVEIQAAEDGASPQFYRGGGAIALVRTPAGRLECWVQKGKNSQYINVLEIADSSYTSGKPGIEGRGVPFEGKDFAAELVTLDAATSGSVTRFFNGAATPSEGDAIKFALGSMAITGTATVAVLFKRLNNGGRHFMIAPEGDESVNAGGHALGTNFGVPLFDSRVPTGEPATPKEIWCLLVVSKETGSKKPRFHIYNFNTKTWSHLDAAEIAVNPSGTPHHGRAGGKLNAVEAFEGYIAAIAEWSKILSDGECEALATVGGLNDWLKTSPVGMWTFDQADASTPITDATGNGADQNVRNGTRAAEEPPPIPYVSTGKTVNVMVGGSIKACKRWILVNGELKSI